MAVVGYARVSSIGQTLEVQLEKLRSNGCEKIYQEKRSGTDSSRPQLQRCLDYVREGDTLVVSKLDRLARSTSHLHRIAEDLRERRIELKVIDQAIDSSTPTGRLLFTMLAAIAEFENDLRRERQMDGIQKAKDKGVQFGRKRQFSDEDVATMRHLRAEGTLIKDIMAKFSISKPHLYRLLNPKTEPA